MDYDDNDFQSQNFQLGADDNKFPLPKFDIDEHLQVNLRFDSLVDTDILLGIQNQDNNWIEDFSSGTSAIEFNSSAAKTICRHTNVWSEATSSESVEMLLKSVGEDEMNNNKAIAMESDLQNASNNLINPVDPTPENDNDSSTMATFVQDDPFLQPDKLERNIPDQNTDASEEVRQCPDSVSDVLTCHNDLSKGDSQTVSLPSVEPTTDSLVLINDTLNVSEISENCDDLLEVVACQVQVSNTESKAVETTGEEQTEIINQNINELGNIEATREVISPVDTNPNTPMKYTVVESSTYRDHSRIDMQTHETETVVVEKGVEVNIIENDEESGSKFIPQQNALQSISSERVHCTTEDVAALVSTDTANLKSNVSLVYKAEVTTSESEDTHMADVGSGSEVPSVEESIDKVKSHLDGPFSENRSSEQKERTSPKSQASDFVNADAKEIKITEDVPNNCDQEPAFKITATADLVLEQIASEVSNQLSSECMNSNETKTSIFADSELAELKGNVDNRKLEDLDICENKLLDPSQQSTMGVQQSCHMENFGVQEPAFKISATADLVLEQNASEVSIQHSSECMNSNETETSIFADSEFAQLEGNVDNRQLDYSNICENKLLDVRQQNTVGVQQSCHVESFDGTQCKFQLQSLPDKPVKQSDSQVVEGNVVSEEEKYILSLPDKSDASPQTNVQPVSGEFSSHSEENILSTPSSLAVKPPITQGDSLMAEENESDKSETFSDANMQKVSSISDCGELPSHTEEIILSTPSQSAVKPPITQGKSPVVEHIVSERENYRVDKSEASPDANFQTLSSISGYGELPSHNEENITSTPSPSAVNPPITQGESPVVEHIVSESEGNRSEKSEASPVANTQTIFTISGHGELPSQSEEIILSPSAVKPPITQGGSPVVEHIVSGNTKFRSDKSDASPDANLQTVSSISCYAELPSHSEENILSTPSPSAVKSLITEGDSPVVEEHIVSDKEKYKSDKSDASPNANIHTVSSISGYGELPSHVEENILSTHSQSAVKPPIVEENSTVAEQHFVSETEKYKSNKSDASLDANMHTVSRISGYGELPSYSVENILSTPSSSAVKPPITQVYSPVVKEHDVSEKEKYNLDKSDAFPDANMKTVSSISDHGESSSQNEKNIMSTPSPSAVKPLITQRDSPVVEEHIVSEKEKYNSDKSNAFPGTNMQTVSSISSYAELPSHSEENIKLTPSQSAVKALVTQVDSTVVEHHIIAEKAKYMSDKLDASPDANIQTVSSISGYDELPSHIEENFVSTPSTSAVKPPITHGDSLVVEHIVCEMKHESDKSDAFPDANVHRVSNIYGELPSHTEENIMSTSSLSAGKSPNTQVDSPRVEEHIVSDMEKYKSDKLDASPGANIQTVSIISGELPSHIEENILSTPSSHTKENILSTPSSHTKENILSTPSPSAVKPQITQGDSPVVEEHNVSERKSDKSDTSPDANMHTVSKNYNHGELPSHSEENILSTPSSSPLEPPITRGDPPMVEEHIVSEKEKHKSDKSSDKSEASPNAKMQTVSGVSAYGELPSHSEENILLTPMPSAVKPPITQGDSPVVEEHIVSEKEKDKSDNSDASPHANMHTVSGGFPSYSEKNILSTPSPSDVKLSGYKIDAIKHVIPDSKKRIATEDDKGFSFEIRKESDVADNNRGNQWNSFPDVLSSDPKIPKEIAKGTSEKKSTKPRAKSTKGTPSRKKSTESAGSSCTTPYASVGTVSSSFQFDEVKLKAESSRKRKFGSPIIQTSSLPDLNSSVSASTLIHQPFSDIQQVQLRAQIFVYGSLIQGIPPDEACMQSAFGEKDGGKSIWEAVWRKSVDRYQTQKAPANQETPVLSHSVVRAPNQEAKSGSSRSKVSDTSASKFVGKSIAPAIPSTPLSVQSPVWSMTPNFPRAVQLDFNQASTPLHSYPSSQTRQFTSNSSPWLPSNPRPAQWAISAQSPALKSATQYSSVLAVDTVKVTPIRESSMPHTSLISSPVPVSIPLESQSKTASAQKSKKKKKALVIEDISKSILVSPSPPTSIVPKSPPTFLPVAPLTTIAPLKVASEPIVETVPHISLPTTTSCQMTNTVNDAQIAKFAEETANKVQQAKLHAEEAASVAASVVSHGQGIWNQIAASKNSSVPIEVETKLSSVAAAAAAASSVAKAAASAAKVAFEAVVQAKVMADEAISSAKTGNHTQNIGANFDARKNLAMLTPGSILKGKDKMHGSSTIISAACDAAQKRAEEASAASKRAEILNAIMKAAELAAEAVSHVGTIIAMGDPLPFKLSELVEAGPEGSWKSLKKANKLKDLEQCEKASVSNQETHQSALKEGEQLVEAEDNCDGSGRREGKKSTLPDDGHEKDASSLEENAFRKGSLVEVISDEDGLKGGWFSARVLDVKDNKVHVCYNNLLSDDGSEQLKEWVSLDSEINGAPRIRIAHPRIVTKNEGTKKRRREATDNYIWEIGDHVDAWMRDGWWEGIITEKSQLDETKLTVHFPAGGDSSLVRAWDLRSSLSWKDGQWTEWSRAEESKPHEGDAPQEKRRKLAQLETKTDAKADGKVANMIPKEPSLHIPERAEASRPLNLSTKDTVFSLGKKDDNTSEALNEKRAGPHKKGPGAVFGVPKGPGKKQKFMEVSKHYSNDKAEKSNHGKDSLKFPKYLMPQPSQPWRNTSKTDSRGKRVVDSRSTGVKPARSLNSNARNAKQKDSNTSVTSASNDENPEKNCTEDSVSSRLRSTESLVAAPNASKRKPSSVNEGDRGVKRRFTPSNTSYRGEKKSEVSESETSDANEPRRSTRKIQPTSRLLEGLQSSMMMSRIPSFSGKSSKTPYRSSSSRGNNRG